MKNYSDYDDVLKKAALQLQKSRIGDYVDLMQKPSRLIFLNFIAGIAKGLGIAIGFTVLGAFAIYIFQKIIMLNLPVIGGIISEIIKMAQIGKSR